MGPSLFTLPQLVDELFLLARPGQPIPFAYETLPVICQYFYEDGTQLKAYQDPVAFARECAAKTRDTEAAVATFLQKSRQLYDLTAHVFLERSLHKLSTYLRKDTLRSMLQLYKLNAFSTMHQVNARKFKDPRLVQLFDRYATYNGSDPYQAPATLNVIPHLEHNVGAYYPRLGMYSIVQALVQLARSVGVDFHFEEAVEEILLSNKMVQGVRVGGVSFPADKVVSNVDVTLTYRHLVSGFSPARFLLTQPRSSSALIFYWGLDRVFPDLDLHNIFFSADYRAEFSHIWEKQTLYEDPTVYWYISSQRVKDDAPPGHSNCFCMINTPPDTGQDWGAHIAYIRPRILQKTSRLLGIPIAQHIVSEQVQDPRTIASRTASFQGALYGNSSNNVFAAFLRHPNFSRKIKGLYFAGGSVHPGGGIPLCLLSAKIIDDLIPAAS